MSKKRPTEADMYDGVLRFVRQGATLQGQRQSLVSKTRYVLSYPRGHVTVTHDVPASIVSHLVADGLLDMSGAKQSALAGTLNYYIPLTVAGLEEAAYRATP